ncbi:MAG TPA: ABC transporter ATP-binding protein [Acholeplasmataceae bacterium]|nr:ABC transporter ATP-binding protein [Acholeplasmataceae bacterium]
MNAIEIKNLSKQYKTFKLDNVSFNVEEGHIVGFVGRNGAGKTTTIKSILNIVKKNSGNVKFFGLDLEENENIIKNKIGFSSGTTNYYPRKKLIDIINITKTFYNNWDDTIMEEYINLFQLDLSKTPSELSEGMKVKFNLLLALSHHAKVLILDEPTSGLDPFSRDEILEVFIELKKRGTAILFSTHITSDLEKCADDIVYIRKGKIVSACSKTDFMQKYQLNDETLENIILRLERENHD